MLHETLTNEQKVSSMGDQKEEEPKIKNTLWLRKLVFRSEGKTRVGGARWDQGKK